MRLAEASSASASLGGIHQAPLWVAWIEAAE